MHPHHNLTGSRLRIRYVLKCHDLRLTEGVDTNRFHGASPVVTAHGSSRPSEAIPCSPGSRTPHDRAAICQGPATSLLRCYLGVAAVALLDAPRKAGITCFPNISIDRIAFSCVMVSVCMIVITWSTPASS